MAKRIDCIQTDRLFLRGIDETDAQLIVEWRSASETYKYFKLPHQITIEEHLHWYNNFYLINENILNWMCIEKTTGNRIGVFGLTTNEKTAEVSYLLSPDAQHKGYATEGVEALIDYAVSQIHIRKIEAEIHIYNTSSIKLIQRLGFHLKGQIGNFNIYSYEV